MREEHRVGIEYLEAATALLQRARNAHPTKGLYEAADLQWWWRKPRSTDAVDQLFWFDDDGRPEAAVIATDWGDRVALDPMLLPDAAPDRVAQVVERGLAHASELGLGTVELEVDRADTVMRDVLTGHGFATKGDGLVETWLAAGARPEISPLPAGYRLCSRLDTKPRPHHFIKRSGPDAEPRLLQTSLYRPDLDLVIVDRDDDYAAHGLFWYDPETATGLVEPMRTEDDHQRRGLARHVLTAGIDRLAEAGAARIKICFEPGNAASKGLYLGVGFEPVKQTDTLARDELARRRDRPTGPRQLETLRLVAAGYTNKEIASALGITPKTVMHHLTLVFQVLGVRTRTEAALWASAHGLAS